MSEFSKAQMSAWDEEYFDHMDEMIQEREDQIWEEMQAEERAKRCMTERDGWTCTELKHDDERHIFRNENPFAAHKEP
jgi:hypothetical protein